MLNAEIIPLKEARKIYSERRGSFVNDPVDFICDACQKPVFVRSGVFAEREHFCIRESAHQPVEWRKTWIPKDEAEIELGSLAASFLDEIWKYRFRK